MRLSSFSKKTRSVTGLLTLKKVCLTRTIFYTYYMIFAMRLHFQKNDLIGTNPKFLEDQTMNYVMNLLPFLIDFNKNFLINILNKSH